MVQSYDLSSKILQFHREVIIELKRLYENLWRFRSSLKSIAKRFISKDNHKTPGWQIDSMWDCKRSFRIKHLNVWLIQPAVIFIVIWILLEFAIRLWEELVLEGPVIKTTKRPITELNCNWSHKTVVLGYTWHGSNPVTSYTKSCQTLRLTKTGYNWFKPVVYCVGYITGQLAIRLFCTTDNSFAFTYGLQFISLTRVVIHKTPFRKTLASQTCSTCEVESNHYLIYKIFTTASQVECTWPARCISFWATIFVPYTSCDSWNSIQKNSC